MSMDVMFSLKSRIEIRRLDLHVVYLETWEPDMRSGTMLVKDAENIKWIKQEVWMHPNDPKALEMI